uniref:LAM_G_DOMAIN domain-containing protein n=1 Tax=Angiostrongylus cantonensis TaxID=6313 RepID=A0A0K0DAK4_ANGCA
MCTTFSLNGFDCFQINLGDSSHAQLISKGTYADGREHTVKAIRSGGEIHLQVGSMVYYTVVNCEIDYLMRIQWNIAPFLYQVDSDADRFSTTISDGHTALNVETDLHYVAGVPASLKTDRFSPDIQWKGFFGCILKVKPSQV